MTNITRARVAGSLVALATFTTFAALAGCKGGCPWGKEPAAAPRPGPSLTIGAGRPVDPLPGETRLRNVRQLTFGGENAEAYWSNDGTRLILQRTLPPSIPADQIFTLDLRSGDERMVSTGKGRTTCAYFLQGDQDIVFASTHFANDAPPPAVRVVKGRYVWPIFDTYEIWRAKANGSGLTRLTDTPGYDAEATVDPVSGRLVFTSMRDGELEVYTMAPDGSDVRRVTNRVGYDGGAFFSHDGKRLVLRSGFLKDDKETEDYRTLLAQGLVMPSRMEITICNADGSGFRQVTDNGKANFAPYFHPDDRHIVFSSNMADAQGRDFDIWLIHDDGSGLEQVTHNPTFDGFPMFSPDGKFLVFASNRYGKERGGTNIFVAEWVEEP
ncbi:MAG: PD40 domain-containing protein [Planctomycetes bacterium]|nr:PD40 domain-containing protein [Planctomycetota bacterium]